MVRVGVGDSAGGIRVRVGCGADGVQVRVRGGGGGGGDRRDICLVLLLIDFEDAGLGLAQATSVQPRTERVSGAISSIFDFRS